VTAQVSLQNPFPNVPEGTVTFLFTDIEGSTKLLTRLRKAYVKLLVDQRLIMRAAFTDWNGREMDTQGDSFFVAFARATEAVGAAVQVQRNLAGHTWPEGVTVKVRMGIHTGEPWNGEEGYVGMDVHLAARIAHVGHGGQVLLSETTTALVRDKLPAGVGLADLSRHILKDIDRPEHICQLTIEGLPAVFPPLTSLKTLPSEGTNLGTLVILQSDDPALLNQRIEIVNLITRLGRKADNDILLPNESPVSRHHAVIEARAGQLFLGEVVTAEEPAGQPNRPVYGTFINGKQVQEPVLLRNGDEIRLGTRLRMRFEMLPGIPDSKDKTVDHLAVREGEAEIPAGDADKPLIPGPADGLTVSSADEKPAASGTGAQAHPGSSREITTPAFSRDTLKISADKEKGTGTWSKSGIIPTSLPGLRIGVATDPGLKRRTEPNQDAVLVIPPENGHPPLFMVADGMGGYRGGELASRMVVKTVEQHYRRQAGRIDDLPALISECLRNAKQTLEEIALSDPGISSFGSTAVLAVILDEQVLIANVGDSRAYRLRYASPVQPASGSFSLGGGPQADGPIAGNPEPAAEIQQLSFDHSLVAAMVRSGLITPRQALESPIRNRLTQSISARPGTFEPFIQQFLFGAEDVLLLSSDGLWSVVSETTMAAIALELTPQAGADKLVQQAVSYGGPDNISIIIVRRRYTTT
jgi:serine/threonine protein phosphatase PrpC/class 3 adenylate cyclase/pSer/pThr/pTyr-binding forkhead associated (FHA) protein